MRRKLDLIARGGACQKYRAAMSIVRFQQTSQHNTYRRGATSSLQQRNAHVERFDVQSMSRTVRLVTAMIGFAALYPSYKEHLFHIDRVT
jgi:hypothetical protein